MKHMLLTKYKNNLISLAQKNNISYLALFGSYARGEAKKASDIDLLVKFRQPVDFFEFGDIEEKFANLLHRPVDMVTVAGLNKYFRPYVEKDLKVIYESA